MSADSAIYQRHSDEVARLATITIETGVDPGDSNYGPASLVDDNPAKVAKIDSTTGAWLFAYAAKQPIQIVALIHHDFDAGADVKIQGNATDDWTGSPGPAFEASIVIPPWLGASPRRWPVNPWLDLTAQPGYDATGFQYWRLVITGNSQNLQLGQVWFGETIRRLDPDLQWNFVRSRETPLIENATAFGVATFYGRGTTRWRLEGDHRMTEALETALNEASFDTDGRVYPWLLVPDGLENRCYFVRWAETTRAVTKYFLDVYDQRFVVQEVSRGLRPGV